jgi:hypothetical protein
VAGFERSDLIPKIIKPTVLQKGGLMALRKRSQHLALLAGEADRAFKQELMDVLQAAGESTTDGTSWRLTDDFDIEKVDLPQSNRAERRFAEKAKPKEDEGDAPNNGRVVEPPQRRVRREREAVGG